MSEDIEPIETTETELADTALRNVAQRLVNQVSETPCVVNHFVIIAGVVDESGNSCIYKVSPPCQPTYITDGLLYHTPMTDLSGTDDD